jgi:hypothetical protein
MVQYLIDGGMASNNPAIYAFQIARYLNNRRNKSSEIRMLSFAAGNSK